MAGLVELIKKFREQNKYCKKIASTRGYKNVIKVAVRAGRAEGRRLGEEHEIIGEAIEQNEPEKLLQKKAKETFKGVNNEDYRAHCEALYVAAGMKGYEEGLALGKKSGLKEEFAAIEEEVAEDVAQLEAGERQDAQDAIDSVKDDAKKKGYEYGLHNQEAKRLKKEYQSDAEILGKEFFSKLGKKERKNWEKEYVDAAISAYHSGRALGDAERVIRSKAIVMAYIQHVQEVASRAGYEDVLHRQDTNLDTWEKMHAKEAQELFKNLGTKKEQKKWVEQCVKVVKSAYYEGEKQGKDALVQQSEVGVSEDLGGFGKGAGVEPLEPSEGDEKLVDLFRQNRQASEADETAEALEEEILPLFTKKRRQGAGEEESDEYMFLSKEGEEVEAEVAAPDIGYGAGASDPAMRERDTDAMSEREEFGFQSSSSTSKEPSEEHLGYGGGAPAMSEEESIDAMLHTPQTFAPVQAAHADKQARDELAKGAFPDVIKRIQEILEDKKKHWVDKLYLLEREYVEGKERPAIPEVSDAVKQIRKHFESLQSLRQMRTGISEDGLDRRMFDLTDNILFGGSPKSEAEKEAETAEESEEEKNKKFARLQALMEADAAKDKLFQQICEKSKKRRLVKKWFKPRAITGAMRLHDRLDAMEYVKGADRTGSFGHNKLQISMHTNDAGNMVVHGSFQVGIDRLRDEKIRRGRSKGDFAKRVDQQMDRFITVAINDFGKGSDKNPFNLDQPENDKYPELALAALMKIKEKAILNGENYKVKVPGVGEVEFKGTMEVTDQEKACMARYGQMHVDRKSLLLGKMKTSKDCAAKTILKYKTDTEIVDGNVGEVCAEIIQKRISDKRDNLKNLDNKIKEKESVKKGRP